MALNLTATKRAALRRFARYASVSIISTSTSLLILGLLVGVFDYSAIWSNVIATGIGTVPSFELNRRWVWSAGGPRSLIRQVLPFCALSFAGLVLSTISVHVAADATASSSRPLHTLAVETANFGSYGVLWLVQFVLCDRVLFRQRSTGASVSQLEEATFSS
jgi:putative flippase GtrA